MDQERVWTRMGRWFRRTGLRGSADMPKMARDGFLEGVSPDNEGEHTPTLKLSRQQLREQAVEKLHDGHLKVVALMDSLQQHMEAPDRRGAAVVNSLDGIAGSMSQLSEAASRQTETLSGIASQLQTGNDRVRRWEEAFAELPALAEAQRATLATLGEQVAAGRRADERIGESLEMVRGALEALDKSSAASSHALLRVQESSAHSQELVGELIQKQRTWLARLVAVTLCVAIAGAALAVIALVR